MKTHILSFLIAGFLSLCTSNSSFAITYYEILGISRSASLTEIKSAFRKRAMELHPDRNQGDKAKANELLEVITAYQTLKDLQKKSEYDRTLPPESTSSAEELIELLKKQYEKNLKEKEEKRANQQDCESFLNPTDLEHFLWKRYNEF